jgi:Arc/MetJ family transcription regulator
VAKRLIELDDGLLDRAQAALGTPTISATVRQALAVVADGDAGQAYVDLLASLDDLGPSTRDDAWRTARR